MGTGTENQIPINICPTPFINANKLSHQQNLFQYVSFEKRPCTVPSSIIWINHTYTHENQPNKTDQSQTSCITNRDDRIHSPSFPPIYFEKHHRVFCMFKFYSMTL